jgi:hypothetical protein
MRAVGFKDPVVVKVNYTGLADPKSAFDAPRPGGKLPKPADGA